MWFFKYKLKSIKLFRAGMKPHELIRKRQFLKKGWRTCSLQYAKSICERCKTNITQWVV